MSLSVFYYYLQFFLSPLQCERDHLHVACRLFICLMSLFQGHITCRNFTFIDVNMVAVPYFGNFADSCHLFSYKKHFAN